MKTSRFCFDFCIAFAITGLLLGIILNITSTSVLDNIIFLTGNERMSQNTNNFFTLNSMKNNGSTFNFSKLKSSSKKAIIIFNSASKSEQTKKNMDGLKYLYKKYSKKGLAIIQFPSNDFNQEPKKNSELLQWVKKNKWNEFILMAKTNVNGKNTSEVYKWLRTNSVLYNSKMGLAKDIPWNYVKFLIDKEGNFVRLELPNVNPKNLESQIKNLLD